GRKRRDRWRPRRREPEEGRGRIPQQHLRDEEVVIRRQQDRRLQIEQKLNLLPRLGTLTHGGLIGFWVNTVHHAVVRGEARREQVGAEGQLPSSGVATGKCNIRRGVYAGGYLRCGEGRRA